MLQFCNEYLSGQHDLSVGYSRWHERAVLSLSTEMSSYSNEFLTGRRVLSVGQSRLIVRAHGLVFFPKTHSLLDGPLTGRRVLSSKLEPMGRAYCFRHFPRDSWYVILRNHRSMNGWKSAVVSHSHRLDITANTLNKSRIIMLHFKHLLGKKHRILATTQPAIPYLQI